MIRKQNFESKLLKRKEHNRKAEWIKNMTKELKGLKEYRRKNTPRLAQTNIQKRTNWKISENGIHRH